MTPQIVITVKPTGEIQVQSNLQDQIVVYGILERAKDAIRDAFSKQANGSGLVAATADALRELQAAGN